MKIKFKIQQYQTDAVENTVAVFTGQPSHRVSEYRRDLGKRSQQQMDFEGETGFRNHRIELDAKTLLKNINSIQNLYDITPSPTLAKGVGTVNLDIEMETGTGKTYVYIKTMFELNKQYGWSKFIIVVPSIAIREGVAKSFKMLEEHFMEHYGKKARWFIYNSSNLQQLDSFSSDSSLSVMIINTQAFASSLKEDGKSKESRIIYSKRDEFGSRRPIDVIAANYPIIIMDEPQKMEGDATQTGIKRFNPLFVLNYSATHKTKHDTIYALDALDAYKQRLVKRIHVKGFEVKNLRGTSSYLYLDNIVLSPKQPPMARIEIETKTASGNIVRKIKTFGVGDSLQAESGLAQYENFTVSEINPNGYVTFLNGTTIRRGEVIGDTNELNMQKVQIRETIKSHFEKERQLFKRGIKCLSLFFIDEVVKYKSYDDEGKEVKGVFQSIFEEEYRNQLSKELDLFDEEYNNYLRRFYAEDVHRGYFSIDKKSGRIIDGKIEKKSGLSDDITAYDLILKNKERLLSFEEPTRFYSVGGDGSINSVMQGLVNTDHQLSVIPLGTGNDFVRMMHDESDPVKCLKKSLNGTIERIDTIQVNDRYFVNTACFGVDSIIANHVHDTPNIPLVPQSKSYIVGILQHVFKYDYAPIAIYENGKELFNGPATLCTLNNGRFYGGGFEITPVADYKDGYMNIVLYDKDKNRKNFKVHRLVAKAFIPNDDNDDLQINHIDGNKKNNRKSNLEWVTNSENQIHARDNGLHGRNELSRDKIKELIHLVLDGKSTVEIINILFDNPPSKEIRKKYIKRIHKIRFNEIYCDLIEECKNERSTTINGDEFIDGYYNITIDMPPEIHSNE